MSTIHVTSFIGAPLKIVFDLSRNISLHKISMDKTGEEAISGTTSGLVGLDDTVTWKGKHLFKTRFFTTRISEIDPPEKLTSKMIKGDFKSFEHQLFFKEAENGTILIDIIQYEMPYGFFGGLVDRFYLRSYIEKIIHQRNETLREYAESDKWMALLNNR